MFECGILGKPKYIGFGWWVGAQPTHFTPGARPAICALGGRGNSFIVALAIKGIYERRYCNYV